MSTKKTIIISAASAVGVARAGYYRTLYLQNGHQPERRIFANCHPTDTSAGR